MKSKNMYDEMWDHDKIVYMTDTECHVTAFANKCLLRDNCTKYHQKS